MNRAVAASTVVSPSVAVSQEPHGSATRPFASDACAENRVTAYWDARSDTYAANVRVEFAASERSAWEDVFAESIPCFGSRPLRVLDLGCGPGFFSTLCALAGCRVDAVDASEAMLSRARDNIAREGVREGALPGEVRFHRSDVTGLPFADNSFDAVVMRNLTWVLPDPRAAYAEWLRVLKPQGRILVFDANWYYYLVDPATDSRRIADQADYNTLGLEDDCRATAEQEDACERIALDMPLTSVLRPAWDVAAMREIGYRKVWTDTEVWRRVWSEGEKAYYGSSPLFLVCGEK